MPALTQRILRRKRALPAAIISGEQSGWPWVEDISSSLKRNNSNIDKSASNSNTAAMASPLQVVNGESANDVEPPKTWFDLPEEIQAHIIKDCTCNDLISLSLVSKHFRELTAQRLYEKFQIIFPDDDDSSFDGSIDSLAAGFETFATSDYNYARFLKNVSMDTVTSGAKGERAYRRYTSDESCGKFMNTLMMLTLRQAKKLDTFHWNIRVELSRPLYQTLHKIETLEHLTIRMHPGRSNYEKPPPLQSLEDDEEEEETERFKDKNSAPSITDILFSHNMKSDKAKSKKSKEPVKETPNPPTLSGFRNLKSLAVLDMDTLEYIPEIRQAIDNSAESLTKLKISFSEQLARAARKPPAPVDLTDDSDVEMDEFGNGLAPPPPPPPIASSDDGSGPQKTLAAQEAKKEQEAVLGKIFGIETTAPKKDKDAKDAKDADGTTTPVVDDVDVEEAKFEKDGQRFIRNILLISKKLMTSMNPNRTQQQKEALEIIEKAAKKYVEEKRAEEDEKKEKAKELAKKDGKGGENLDGKKTDEAKPADEKSKGKEKEDEEGPSLFDDNDEEKKEKTEVADDAANPDDINVEEPEIVVDEKDLEDAIESGDDAPQITWQELENLVAKYAKEYEAGELAADETSLYLNVLAPALSLSPADTTHFNKCVADAEIRKAAFEFQTMVEARKKTESEEELRHTVNDDESEQLETLILEHAISNPTRDEKEVVEQMKKVLAVGTDMESIKKAMGNYVRSTRGLQLKTLALYLIPIKASTLSKAIDIRCLNRITLLNVGPQAAFWTHMEKENALLPLPLQNIQTDNVSASFLKFVEKMEKCAELFMLERNTKVEIYSTAPKSGVTIGQIRKALRHKWPCLKRLVIRNESDYAWDANERFLETLCRRGTNLEELGIAFSSKGVHHLLQDFHGLSSLRAFHILNFRNDDTCHWVLREVRKFIVDIVAHHSEMKLEYIAQDSNVERILWEKPKPKKAKVTTPGSSEAKVDIKGKGKAIDTGLGSPLDSPMPTLNAGPIFPSLATMVAGEKEMESSSEEETEDEAPGSGGSSSSSVPGFKEKKGLKCRTIDHGKVADVWGVRMWRKEVLSARI